MSTIFDKPIVTFHVGHDGSIRVTTSGQGIGSTSLTLPPAHKVAVRAIADPKLVGRMQVTLEVGPKTDAQPGQATLGFKGAGYDFRVDGPYRQLYPIVRALQAWSELALGAFNGNLCIECGEPLYEVTETRLVCAQQHRTAVAAPGSPVVDGYMVCSADDIAWRDDETPEPVEITDLTIRGWK